MNFSLDRLKVDIIVQGCVYLLLAIKFKKTHPVLGNYINYNRVENY